MMNEDVVGSEAFRAEANGIVNDLLTQLPPESRRALGPDDAGVALLIRQLSAEGSEEVLARLAAADSDGPR